MQNDRFEWKNAIENAVGSHYRIQWGRNALVKVEDVDRAADISIPIHPCDRPVKLLILRESLNVRQLVNAQLGQPPAVAT
jgi:hypothetical protein